MSILKRTASPLTHICLLLILLIAGGCKGRVAEGQHRTRPAIPSAEELKALPPDGGPRWNRLVFEKSPYLLQHAANPVDWYPWGDEAFEKAARENKPVFLSVGYSTCHWCHVMEHESFEDPDVAKLINSTFVPVKVDREERPDVDHIYMNVTQAMTGRGGWPMTVFLTPDKKPFFAGTYFPKTSRHGQPGITELIQAVDRAWREDRSRILENSDEITSALQSLSASSPLKVATTSTLDTAFRVLRHRFDAEHGGFGSAPKFPTPHQLSFLLRYHDRTGNPEALAMVEKTLHAMRQGGIFDQLGYGFHRYSTDRVWLLPHFEKMLYDQALASLAYVEAHHLTRKEEYADTARLVYEYVLRDMTSPEGGFYSAEDADSEGVEGKFYVWTSQEIQAILGKEDAALVEKVWGIQPEGNFRDEASGKQTGENILHRTTPIADIARQLNQPVPQVRERLEKARQKLFDAREKRVHPQKDDKVLADWNGLMIGSMARASQVLSDDRYSSAAAKAADFVLSRMKDERGRLLKSWRGGEAGEAMGLLDDYAFMVWGLIELYEATFEVTYLREALALNQTMLEHFWDEKNGGLFLSPDDGEKLLVRAKEFYDGAIPSGNSIAAHNLQRLAAMTGRMELAEKAEALMHAAGGRIAENPAAHSQMLVAIDFLLGPQREVVIAGDIDSTGTLAMIEAVREHFLPRTVLLHRPPGDKPPVSEVAPFTQSQKPQGGRPTAYVCEKQSCSAPTGDVRRLRELLPAVAHETTGSVSTRTKP